MSDDSDSEVHPGLTRLRAAWALHSYHRLLEARRNLMRQKNTQLSGEQANKRASEQIAAITQRIRDAAAEYRVAQRDLGLSTEAVD
ncbi:hypothetical protein B0H11DRAFT_2233309 [Mycena galericulata]|nr:hypothetical protein B0H11DRAFT_2233261 [Mycena galericulata]KAJ7480533.1 hypothetical protein B0H11DRAFT_2233309 [Mycena galericulata]